MHARLVIGAISLWLVIVPWPSIAGANPCDCGDDVVARPAGLRLELSAAAARFEQAGAPGHYQGVGLAAAWTHDRLAIAASLASWRLVRDGEAVVGVGDLMLAARGTLWRDGERLALGGELAGHLPTGDADLGLGMGHVMLMPSLWARWQPAARWQLAAQVGWARALAGHPTAGHAGHHDAGGAGSIVNPMSFSELGVAAAAAWSARPWLILAVTASHATPIEVEGSSRGLVGLGVRATRGTYTIGVEGQLPVVGEPFAARALAFVAATF